MVKNTDLAKVVIEANPNYDLQTMGSLQNSLSGLSEKAGESYLKRTKSMAKTINFAPYENWFLYVGRELSQIGRIVSDTVLTIYPHGAPKQYIDAVVFELAGYQLKNIKAVCNHVAKNYSEGKALPPLSFWLQCISAVKSEKRPRSVCATPFNREISKEEQAEVKKMMHELAEKFGSDRKKDGVFTNKTTLIRHYGILLNLNKGLRQVPTLDDKNYEWVDEWGIGDRKPIDHGKTIEMFNSGRISERKACKAYEKAIGKKKLES